MKYFVIGDQDTVAGFRFAGLRGKVVDTPADAARALDSALQDETLGIIIITERVAAAVRDKVDAAIFARPLPVIVEIPDRTGPLSDRKSLMELIRQAVGVGV